MVKRFLQTACLAVMLLAAGCANMRVTNPTRTATEQFLLSHAASEAIDTLSFAALFGRRVYVDSSHFAPAEKEFVLSAFRARMFASGVQLSDDPCDAEIIVEIRSRGVGIDRYESLIGIPAIAAPAGAGALAGGAEGAVASALITPELAITKTIKQYAYASIAYVAYWKDTGQIVSGEGPSPGKAFREDWWFLGMGPKTIGNIITTQQEFE